MASPYSSQTILNYNASPPSDDGSETSANTLKWSNHKDKLADPIKTLAEAINTELVSAFAKVMASTYVTKSTNYSVAAADQGKVIEVDTGAVTITLPAAATAGQNFPLVVMNTSAGLVTVDGNASETIVTASGALTAVTLFPGQTAVLTCNGTNFIAYVTDLGPQIKSATNTSWTSDTSLADITGLDGFYLAQNGEYEFEVYLRVSQNVGDFQFAIAADAPGAAGGSYVYHSVDESGNAAQGFEPTTITNANAITTMTDNEVYGLLIRGRVLGNASQDLTNFRIRGAQNTSSANATTVDGSSWMKVRRIH